MILEDRSDQTTEFYVASGDLLNMSIDGADPESTIDAYGAIILASHGHAPRLRQQVALEIAKYFHLYPSMQESALDALLVSQTDFRICVKIQITWSESKLYKPCLNYLKFCQCLHGFPMSYANYCKVKMIIKRYATPY
jgi:hypothetical protein